MNDNTRLPGEGEIIFNVQGHEEIIRITPDGEFYVKGNKVADDVEVYRAFVEFLKAAGHYKGD
jgi:hypothetical protein